MKLTIFICKFSYINCDAELDAGMVYVKYILLEEYYRTLSFYFCYAMFECHILHKLFPKQVHEVEV